MSFSKSHAHVDLHYQTVRVAKNKIKKKQKLKRIITKQSSILPEGQISDQNIC